jgi:protein-disulfide isomerase
MTKKVVKQANRKQFIGVLVLVVVAGVGGLGYALTRTGATAITVDPTIPAGAAEGHLLGKADAPVQVMEFGDFECPGCGDFANITEPDVRTRLVNPGIVAFRFFDFPLTQHRNTWTAHNAAACADDQGKFWEMHDRLYAGQLEWNTEATSNPVRVMTRYANELGMDVGKWQKCVSAQAHAGRIKGNQAEGTRRNIQSTPTFIIGPRQISTSISFDVFKSLVDSALGSAKADSASRGAKGAAAKGAATKGGAAKKAP